MISHPIPERPWQRVASDIFELNNNKYLFLSDYYSNYFEVNKLTTATAQNVINICKEQFARHGIPEVLVTDSGTQFTS